MPELDPPYWEDEDYDGPRTASDPRHDALMSNPDLREAFNEFEAAGLSTDEAHYRARKAVFGDDWEPDNPEYYPDELVGGEEKSLTFKDHDYEEIDDALAEAYERSVWWKLDTDPASLDLQKAPGIWTHDDEVPEMVRDLIEQVIEQTDWDWSDFENLSTIDARKLVEMLKEKLTQPQGWSVGSLAEDIEDRLDLPQEAALGIARDASHNVLSVTREEAYDEMEGSDEFVFDWANPYDHRTTPVCNEIKHEIEARGGAVEKDVLKEILRDKAQKYEGTREGGGTPQRVKYWEPHYQCRSMMVRRVRNF